MDVSFSLDMVIFRSRPGVTGARPTAEGCVCRLHATQKCGRTAPSPGSNATLWLLLAWPDGSHAPDRTQSVSHTLTPSRPLPSAQSVFLDPVCTQKRRVKTLTHRMKRCVLPTTPHSSLKWLLGARPQALPLHTCPSSSSERPPLFKRSQANAASIGPELPPETAGPAAAHPQKSHLSNKRCRPLAPSPCARPREFVYKMITVFTTLT